MVSRGWPIFIVPFWKISALVGISDIQSDSMRSQRFPGGSQGVAKGGQGWPGGSQEVHKRWPIFIVHFWKMLALAEFYTLASVIFRVTA